MRALLFVLGLFQDATNDLRLLRHPRIGKSHSITFIVVDEILESLETAFSYLGPHRNSLK